MTTEMQAALAGREALIETRALALAAEAVRTSAPWLRRLGTPPTHPKTRHRWLHELRTVTAYRDRYEVPPKAWRHQL